MVITFTFFSFVTTRVPTIFLLFFMSFVEIQGVELLTPFYFFKELFMFIRFECPSLSYTHLVIDSFFNLVINYGKVFLFTGPVLSNDHLRGFVSSFVPIVKSW